MTNKATKTLNFTQRTLYKCNSDVKEVAIYNILVRLLLEYASITWDPQLRNLVN